VDLYLATSYELAERLTKRYSTSFSMSSSLFDHKVRPYIYAIYGMVRIADEIVDTYAGNDTAARLDEFERAVYDAVETGYSTNPILHAFADTCRFVGIDHTLIKPFFASMRADLTRTRFTRRQYDAYIYGSAEVVGLMCLRVFVEGNERLYESLRPSAQALGSAYQKVNFLRDMQADFTMLGRVYFPGVVFDTFDDAQKEAIVREIRSDFAEAAKGVYRLPRTARRAVALSKRYYELLLDKLETASAYEIARQRIRISNWRKFWLYIQAKVGRI
jgi:phytoene/squalene synthetase